MKKYSKFLVPTLFVVLFSVAGISFAQSELFGEKVNADFLEQIQPGLLEQAANPETSPYDFMLIAKRLGVYGDPSAAQAMAPWLADSEKSHSARNALEEMPFDEALGVLRNAVGTVDEPVLKAGVIESLGMRRDKNAVEIILPFLESENEIIANAALFALCRIADPAYRDTLVGKLAAEDIEKNRKTADLLLMYGEFLRRDGNEKESLAVYQALADSAPASFYKEAACYQILLRETDEARQKAAAWLIGDDETAFKATLRASAFVKSDGVCEALLTALDKVPANRKPAIYALLGDQKNLKAQNALLAALDSDDEAVQATAVGALKAFSDPETMTRLIETALASNDDALVAKAVAVIEHFDETVDPEILKLLDSDAAHQKIGAELVAAHKLAAGREKLLDLAQNGPETVRPSALAALGFIADNSEFDFLASFYAKSGDDKALGALYAACGVVTDKAAAADTLVKTADSLVGQKEKRLAVFGALARIGGRQARQAVERAALSDDAQSQDLASQTLGAWMEPDVAPTLLKLANTPGYRYANRSLRGALRLAKQFAMPDWMRCAIVRDALASPVCGDREKELADLIVKQYKLDLDAPLTDEQAILMNTEIVEAIFGDPNTPEKTKDVTAKLREAFSKSDSSTLAADGGYNAFFGGDPARGVPKKLRVTVRYRDDDSQKTVEFGENAPIVLPAK